MIVVLAMELMQALPAQAVPPQTGKKLRGRPYAPSSPAAATEAGLHRGDERAIEKVLGKLAPILHRAGCGGRRGRRPFADFVRNNLPHQ